MQVSFNESRNRFECRSEFSEKDIIKNAGGWLWDKVNRIWWTKFPEKAVGLAQYADESAQARMTPEVLQEAADKAKAEQDAKSASLEASRATDANVDVPCPAGLSYLPYQKAGIVFGMHRPGTLIGDEPGLGKTIQAIGISNADPNVRKVLIVCPASLRLNWLREWQKWDTKDLMCGMANGSWPYSDVVIINYDILEKFSDQIRRQDWDLLIVDEAHYVKSDKALRTHQVFGRKATERTVTRTVNKQKFKQTEILPAMEPIKAARRVFLTGTPIVNRPIELWTLVQSLDPNGLGKDWLRYATRYCDAHRTRFGWETKGASNLEELQIKLRSSIMVRRLKRDVLKELPPKRRQIITLPANGLEEVIEAENRAYNRIEEAIENQRTQLELAKASDDPEVYANAVKALRDAVMASFAELSKARIETAIAKIPFIIERLREAVEAEGKIVFMGHHHSIVDAVAKEFGHDAVVVDGRVSLEDRQAAVDRFQKDPSCKLFIGTIKAAGVGLTLTASSAVIFGELDWTPGNVTQAEDRCHRIGQKDFVLVQHIVLDGSLDARMAKTLVGKQNVIDAALDNAVSAEAIEAANKPQHEMESDPMPLPAEDQPATYMVTREQIEKEAPSLSAAAIQAIHTGLRLLAGVCDGAMAVDGHGFNKFDARIGRTLAQSANLSARQAVLGQKLVRKYRRQLPAEVLNGAMGE